MLLRERIEQSRKATDAPLLSAVPARDDSTYQKLKLETHRKLLERVDLVALERLPAERVRAEIKVLVQHLLKDQAAAINASEHQRMVEDIQHEVLGYGPLEPLLADPSVSDILVNTHAQVYVERAGRLHLTDVRFANDAHLMKIIDKIVSGVGRRIDESSPMVDARLPDGSRVNAIIPPLAIDGPVLSIRRFAVDPLKKDDLIRLKTFTPEIGALLDALVKARLNLLISGGTGSGKTTLLNILSGFIPVNERIVTIEDAAELQLQQPHVVRLETRPPNIEGKGEITPRALVRNSLRMRPDRIVVGEVRGAEVLDMLQAMNTGHEGSMTTVHANSPRDALTRLDQMMSMSGVSLPNKVTRHQISSALTVVVQAARLADGTRKVISIQEITGMEGDMITMQEIFQYERSGVGANGEVLGRFRASGIRPKFMQRLRNAGITLDESMFDPRRIYE